MNSFHQILEDHPFFQTAYGLYLLLDYLFHYVHAVFLT